MWYAYQGCNNDQYYKNLDLNKDTDKEPMPIPTQNFKKSSSVCNERKCVFNKWVLNRSIMTSIKVTNNRVFCTFIGSSRISYTKLSCPAPHSDMTQQYVIMQVLKNIFNIPHSSLCLNFLILLFCYVPVEIEIL